MNLGKATRARSLKTFYAMLRSLGFSSLTLRCQVKKWVMILHFRKITAGIMKTRLLGFRTVGNETVALINCCHNPDLKKQGLEIEVQLRSQ